MILKDFSNLNDSMNLLYGNLCLRSLAEHWQSIQAHQSMEI